MSKFVTIWTDGSCHPNPGPGGWGAILRSGSDEKEVSGWHEYTTNNQMELMAAIEALASIKPAHRTLVTVTIHTDSKYLRNGITTWVPNWKRKGWRTWNGDPVKNKDMWVQLDELVQDFNPINWKWVKSHNGHEMNERVDQLAVAARKRGIEERVK